MRRLLAFSLVALVLALPAIWVLTSPVSLFARFGHDECQRVVLRDAVSGQAIVGAEDMALSASGNLLLFTAYDRRADDLAPGGLYVLDLEALSTGEELLPRLLYAGAPEALPFRPHGLAISLAGNRLAVVNRPGPATAEVLIGELGPEDWLPDRRITGERLCRANDLTFTGAPGDALAITLDRSECTAALADLMPGARTGSVVLFDGGALGILREGLAFPNGIAGPYVAETRSMRVTRPGSQPLRLPGGPDNLTMDERGWIVAAVHPKLVLLALYRAGWRGAAPSRAVRVDPDDGEVQVLFDDPTGALFSAATVALQTDDLLILGSAFDEGLLVCREVPQ